MKFINFPMPNDQFFCNVDAIAELVRRGRSVAVHCRADPLVVVVPCVFSPDAFGMA